VLVANRGEIAVRIIQACRALRLRAIAVYSDADADAPHVRMADEAFRVGPPPARDSYLDADALLAAAKAGGADAVHPGYGLLSEDADFATRVTQAGLVFVGPAPSVLARMSDKVAARAVASENGVPVLPGSDRPVDPDDRAATMAAAERIGWPIVVKASFGGGGRGMRVVPAPGPNGEELINAVRSAGREAAASFGRAEVHLERYLDRPRHIEVQLLGDGHGRLVHLGDRDCSVQRRHQKLLEEAPAPGLAPALRAELHRAALRIAGSVGYQGAGTVEFLVLPSSSEYFFLEMNPRLQVEHGVTELITGIDLVVAQLRVAAGERLWFDQPDVLPRGHAIQARLAAEDPWRGFAPTPGRVHRLDPPLGPWLRCDLGVRSGDSVPPDYDSMFGKLLAWGPDRDAARRRLADALGELRIEGIASTAPYLRQVLGSESFVSATHHTGSVAADWPPDAEHAPDPLMPINAGTGGGPDAGQPDRPGRSAGSDRSGRSVAGPVRRVRIHTDRGPLELDVPGRAASRAGATAPSRRDRAAGPSGFRDERLAPVAPMDATVLAVRVAEGDRVEAGDVLVTLEAMKMEIEVRAPAAGQVRAVLVRTGEAIGVGAPVVSLD
jgi:acetyl-CoA/propionyl-CoA carboxylase biotin carboxyl carrier protein